MDKMRLIVNGLAYDGWKEASVTRAIESPADTFNASYAERWNELDEPLPINETDSIVVKLEDDLVLTGFVDDSNLSYSASSHDASIAGRSLAGDLIDCAAVFAGSQWVNSSLQVIADNIAQPFGIAVEVRGDTGAVFKKFAIQEGETAMNTLNRAARMRSMLVISKPDGGLLLTRTGSRSTGHTLIYGVNIISGSAARSTRDKFSEYTAKVQVPGSDTRSGRDVTFKRQVFDFSMPRYRPTVLMPSTEDTGAELEQFLVSESNRRAGAAEKLTYTVLGWRDDSGALWEPNTLVQVDDPILRVHGEQLITSVQYSKGSSGTTTQLQLAVKEAYDLVDMPAPRPSSGGHGRHH